MAFLDSIYWQVIKNAAGELFIVLSLFVFAVVLDISVGLGERSGLISSDLCWGMRQTALIIFRVHQAMICYMVGMAGFVLMIEYTKRLWSKFL